MIMRSIAVALDAVLARCPVAMDVFRALDLACDRAVLRLVGVTWSTLSLLPRNGTLWAYTIRGADGSPYVDRVLLPRVFGRRVILHRIYRADRDPWMHNHPWRTARFLILSGGYAEERPAIDGGRNTRWLGPGDVNRLHASDFHRIVHVVPNTCTIGLLRDRCQDWGFLVDDRDLVPAERYFAQIAYQASGVQS